MKQAAKNLLFLFMHYVSKRDGSMPHADSMQLSGAIPVTSILRIEPCEFMVREVTTGIDVMIRSILQTETKTYWLHDPVSIIAGKVNALQTDTALVDALQGIEGAIRELASRTSHS